MADNVLMKVTQSIRADVAKECVRSMLENALSAIENVYSYIVYAEYENGTFKRYVVQYNLSQEDKYNTITTEEVIEGVTKTIQEHSTETAKRVIGYAQPDIALILELYDPLVNKLARIQDGKWSIYTHEDLCQICRLEILQLYRKGYYLHKRLVEKAFINRLLMNTRNERNKPTIVSFEDTFYRSSSSDSEKLMVADTIPDQSLIDAEKYAEEEVAERLIFEEVKGIIIDLIGSRRWDELLRSYGGKTTTTTTRKLMQVVKNHFENLGITRKDFNKRYYE